VRDFYTKPLCSPIIGIQAVDGLSKSYSYWPLSKVYENLVRLPFEDGFVVLPLLHTAE